MISFWEDFIIARLFLFISFNCLSISAIFFLGVANNFSWTLMQSVFLLISSKYFFSFSVSPFTGKGSFPDTENTKGAPISFPNLVIFTFNSFYK